MILTSLQHASVYECLGRRFRAAFEFLRNTDLHALELGRHAVEGDDVFALPQEITTKPEADCRWEAHRKYADIQYILTGTERMGVGPMELFTEETPYNDTKDVAFYRLTGTGHSTVVVPAGYFTIFLPKDVHQPLIWSGSPEKVRKVVMKVRV